MGGAPGLAVLSASPGLDLKNQTACLRGGGSNPPALFFPEGSFNEGAVSKGGGPLSSYWTVKVTVLLVAVCELYVAWAITETVPIGSFGPMR